MTTYVAQRQHRTVTHREDVVAGKDEGYVTNVDATTLRVVGDGLYEQARVVVVTVEFGALCA